MIPNNLLPRIGLATKLTTVWALAASFFDSPLVYSLALCFVVATRPFQLLVLMALVIAALFCALLFWVLSLPINNSGNCTLNTAPRRNVAFTCMTVFARLAGEIVFEAGFLSVSD